MIRDSFKGINISCVKYFDDEAIGNIYIAPNYVIPDILKEL